MTRIDGEHLIVHVGHTSDCRHAAPRTSESSTLQGPVSIPVLHEVCQFESLGRLGKRLLNPNSNGVSVVTRTVKDEDRLANSLCAPRQLKNTFIYWRRKLEGAHFLALNPIVEFRDLFGRQCFHPMHDSDYRCGVRRIAVRICEVGSMYRQLQRLTEVAFTKPDTRCNNTAIDDRVVRCGIFDSLALIDSSENLLRRATQVCHRNDHVQTFTIRRIRVDQTGSLANNGVGIFLQKARLAIPETNTAPSVPFSRPRSA
jgi:hypothetical protein